MITKREFKLGDIEIDKETIQIIRYYNERFATMSYAIECNLPILTEFGTMIEVGSNVMIHLAMLEKRYKIFKGVLHEI